MKAPDFTLMDQNNQPHSLKQYLGKKVLLYFYPKDDTPGCTAQACGFRDSINDLKAAGVQVLGVSCDTTSSHRKFAEKFNLNFPLLADAEKMVVRAYDVWGEKQMFGRTFDGIKRESFLINETGEIIKHYTNIDTQTHAQTVLSDIVT